MLQGQKESFFMGEHLLKRKTRITKGCPENETKKLTENPHNLLNFIVVEITIKPDHNSTNLNEKELTS